MAKKWAKSAGLKFCHGIQTGPKSMPNLIFLAIKS